MYDEGAIELVFAAGVVPEPKDAQTGEAHEVPDFREFVDAVLAEVELGELAAVLKWLEGGDFVNAEREDLDVVHLMEDVDVLELIAPEIQVLDTREAVGLRAQEDEVPGECLSHSLSSLINLKFQSTLLSSYSAWNC